MVIQGWMELAGARYSMGASRVNTALLNLQPHSAATTVEITHDQDGTIFPLTLTTHILNDLLD